MCTALNEGTYDSSESRRDSNLYSDQIKKLRSSYRLPCATRRSVRCVHSVVQSCSSADLLPCIRRLSHALRTVRALSWHSSSFNEIRLLRTGNQVKSTKGHESNLGRFDEMCNQPPIQVKNELVNNLLSTNLKQSVKAMDLLRS